MEEPSSAQVSGLTDELMRRLSIREAATSSQAALPTSPSLDHRDVSRHPRLFCEERHDAGDDGKDRTATEGSLVLKWRQKEKLKTTAVALVLCLNIGVDPPDVIKISPCARLECWVDPNSMQPAKALEAIGKNLQAQYERWQPKAKYKMHLDPTMDDVKKLAQSSRRNAKAERVLFHYNGHGVPRPTANGELWVFNQRYTQYIPMSVYDLHTWLGTPAIYVLDCSSAGVLIGTFRNLMDQRHMEIRGMPQAYPGLSPPLGAPSDPMREIIVLAACGANEVLPQSPELPADVFTACLTTPIKVALRWFASRSLLRHDGITKELIDKIPGRQTDRKTPLGELNWIFTAITDTVAWNVLPRALFQKLFRSDLLVASLFRNFLLAERIMMAVGCSPMSLPRLPPTHQHPMWQAWDMAAEMCLMQLPTLLSDPAAEFQPSPFFSEQLTAFELWLSSGSRERAPPEQLPIVLQVLLSQVHRLRALVLLGRFLDMGSWAVDLALSVGIFPYVLKLLQTTSQDLRATLVFIWAKILALDKSCQVDLIKDTGHTYFIRYLDSQDAGVEPHSRAQATFVLSVICDGHPKGQTLCASNGLLTVLLRWLRTYFPPQVSYPAAGHVLLLKWLCLCLGKLCQDSPEISLMAIREGAADLLVALITVAQPEIRAAAVFGLGCLVHAPGAGVAGGAAGDGTGGVGPSGAHMAAGHGGPSPLEDRLPAEQLIANAIRQVVYDPSVLVRCELAVLYARYVRGHAAQVQEALALQQRRLNEFARQHLPAQQPLLVTSADGYPSAEAEGAAVARGTNLFRSMDGPHDAPASSLPRAARSPSDHTSPGHTGGTLGVGSGGSAGSGVIDRPGSAPLTGMMPPGTPGVGRAVSAIYTAMVESMQLLALDPSPRVARLGRQVLRGAQCELSFVGAGVGPAGPQSPHHPSAGTLGAFAQKLRRPGWVGSRSSITQPQAPTPSQQPQAAPGSGPGSRQSGIVPSSAGSNASGTHPGAMPVPAAGAGGFGTAGGVPMDPAMLELQAQYSMPGTPSHGSSPSSPVRDFVFSRPPYVLCCKNDTDPWPRTGHMYGGPITSTLHGAIGQQPASPASTASAAAAAAAQAASLSGQLSGQPSLAGSNASSMRPIVGPNLVLQNDLASYSLGGLVGGAGGAGAGGYGTAGLGGATGLNGGVAQEPLPQSQVYRLSCEAFARPLLEPGASSWREGGGAAAPHWATPPDLKRRQERINAMHGAMLSRCRLTQPKLREQVFSVDTQGDGLAKLCFHPYHNLLVCADMLGYIRVMAYDTQTASKPIHAFHVSNGAPPGDARVLPTTITHLQHITEADGPLLLTGAADGAVRIWRSHAVVSPPGVYGPAPSMATAMQAVTINLPPGPGRSTCYAWAGSRCQLMAAGGSHPDMVYCWDMNHEMCAVMIPMSPTPHSPSAPNPYVDSLHLGVADPNLLLAACSDHALRLFDIRASRAPVLTLMPFKAQLAGVALEPAGRPGMIVAASEKGELVLLDSRAALNAQQQAQQLGTPLPGLAELSAAATSKVVAAHSKGGVSCLVAHSYAPLLATGTTNQVVKVWTDQCDVVGAIRAHSSAAPSSHKSGGTVSCMAWHPYQPLLAAGGYDSVATVYAIEQAHNKQAGGATGSSFGA